MVNHSITILLGYELTPQLPKHSENKLNMLKLDDDTSEKGKINLAESIDKKGYEDKDLSQHNFLDNKDSINQNQSESNSVKAPPSNPQDEKEKEHCADKAATEACQTVKDKCIHEGLALEKLLLETTDATKKDISGFKSSTTNTDDDLSGQLTEGVALVTQDLKITSVVANDSQDQNSSCGLFELRDKLKADAQAIRDMPDQKISFQPLLPMGDFERISQQSDTFRFDFSGDHKLHICQKNTEQVNLDELCSTSVELAISDTNSSQTSGLVKNHTHVVSLNTIKDGCSVEKVESSDVTESAKGRWIKENPSSGGKGGKNMTPNFNPGAMTIKDREESSDNADSEQFICTQNYSASDEMVLDGVSSLSRCTFYQNNLGDLNSSGPFYLSGPKASSGHIAFSGSISLRSDSSTTSTRSFAFPILQPEWNSSPVKMAKADRRHLRKHRCWRTGLFCCKF